ncbi:MAG: protein kinase [Myxococcota bacterium]
MIVGLYRISARLGCQILSVTHSAPTRHPYASLRASSARLCSSNHREPSTWSFMELHSEQRVGDFQLRSILGKGGMGSVWEAKHLPTKRLVAIKFVSDVPSDAQQAQFDNEIQSVARLDHPGVVRLFERGTHEGRPYLVMERLESTLPTTRQPWSTVRRWVSEILDALAHVHARGIIHLDVKPSNILLDRDQRLRISDFGVAQLIELEQGSHIVGSLPYMSPEQLSGSGWLYGPWTDLYALGCVAMELFVGLRRFPDRHLYPASAWGRLPPRPLPVMPETAKPILAWISRLLQPSIHQRFRQAADALRALEQLPDVPSGLDLGAVEALGDDTWIETATTPMVGGSLSDRAAAPQIVSEDDLPPPARIPSPQIPQRWRLLPRPGRSERGLGSSLVRLREPEVVGREDIQEQLWRALSRAQPSAVALRGPVGVGRTRLARWLCERAETLGAAHAILIDCHDADLGEAIRRFFRRRFACGRELSDDVVRSRLREQIFEADDVVEHVAQLLSASAAGDPQTALVGWIRHLALQRRAVVVFDDAHRSESVISLVEKVLKEAGGAALVVLTLEEAQLAEVPQMEARLAEIAGLQEIRVGPLSDDAQAELIRRQLDVEDALLTALCRRTAGNPLFAAQLLRDWAEQGLLRPGPQGFQLSQPPPPPTSLTAVWSQRLERLLAMWPDEAGVGLEIAAALGIVVSDAEWEAACAVPGPVDAIVHDGLIEMLIERRLIKRTDDGWRFRHTLFREALLARADRAGRLVDHNSRCADSLPLLEHGRERSPDTPTMWRYQERIGRYLYAAQRWEDARERLRLAANQRLSKNEVIASQELIEMTAHAVEASQISEDHIAHLFLQLLRIRFLSRTEQVDESLVLLQQLRARAEVISGWKHMLPEILLQQGRAIAYKGQTEAAIEALHALLRLEPALLAPRDIEARACMFLAYVFRYAGRLDDAVQILERGGAAIQEHPSLNVGIMLSSGVSKIFLNRLDDAEEDLIRSNEAAKQMQNASGQVSALCSLAVVEMFRGDREAAQRALDDAAPHIQNNDSLYSYLLMSYQLCCLRRDFDAAEGFMSRLMDRDLPRRLELEVRTYRLVLDAARQRWSAFDDGIQATQERLDDPRIQYLIVEVVQLARAVCIEQGQPSHADRLAPLIDRGLERLPLSARRLARPLEL